MAETPGSQKPAAASPPAAAANSAAPSPAAAATPTAAKAPAAAAKPAPAPAKKKEKPVKVAQGPSKIKRFTAQIKEMVGGLRSEDPATRWMSFVFALSTLGMLSVALYAAQHAWNLREKSLEISESQKAAAHLGEFIRKQAEENKLKASLLPLGTFTVELKPLPGQKPIPGVMNLAEIDLTIEADNKNTRDWIEENLPKVRNQITNTLTALDRSTLMSHEGKRRLIKALSERINTLLPRGQVNEIFITKLVLT